MKCCCLKSAVVFSTMTNFESLRETLRKHGQEHLLQFWEELNDVERKQLISDIQEFNLDEVQSFFERAKSSLAESSAKLDNRLKPVPDSSLLSIARTSKEQLKVFNDEGERKWINNYYVIIVCAHDFVISSNSTTRLFQAWIKSPIAVLVCC